MADKTAVVNNMWEVGRGGSSEKSLRFITVHREQEPGHNSRPVSESFTEPRKNTGLQVLAIPEGGRDRALGKVRPGF